MAGSNLYTGTLDLLILRALSARRLHGYAIGKWLRETSNDVLRVEEGALYPALHRLERRGWLDAEWGLTDTGRQAKFYGLTDAGSGSLRAESDRWNEHVEAMAAVLTQEH